MIDIKWAKENCKENLAAKRAIAKAEAAFEKQADEAIKDACDQGKNYAYVGKCSPTHFECIALENIRLKYEAAGYITDVTDVCDNMVSTFTLNW